MRQAKRQAKGFTLIELMVVITILGVLVAIAIPSLSAYRNQGYCGRVQSDARHAFSAMEAYYAQNLAYGALSDTTFASSQDVSVTVGSTFPLVIVATDGTTRCPQGNTYTLSNQSGLGTWS